MKIPKRSAMEIVASIFEVVGVVGGGLIAFGMIMVGIANSSTTESFLWILGGIVAGVLFYANFAVWGQILEVFQNIEKTQIKLYNHFTGEEESTETKDSSSKKDSLKATGPMKGVGE